MRSRTRLAVAAMVAGLIMLPVAALGTSAEGPRDWTVLMYFGADNDLYQATEFCVDQTLKGLKEVGADRNKVAVVLLIDGPKNGDTKVYELTKDGKTDMTVSALGSQNPEKKMTDPETLSSFISWAMPEFEAYKTMLVLKNGHAWCGICPDAEDNDGNELILMPIDGVRSAIESACNADTGLWIDAIVFDGDNMGSFEVAYELREVTDYFVGSQQQVPLEGLPYYLFMKDLGGPTMDVQTACVKLADDYVKYYNNTKGSKPIYDKLLANSQMAVTAAVFRMGEEGEKIVAVKEAFDAYLGYMLHGDLTTDMKNSAVGAGVNVEAKVAQWYYPDPTTSDPVWSWIPLNRNNVSSARDCALIGKMNDQQGYEWLPDVYTWLWAVSGLANYESYYDAETGAELDPTLADLKDPFVRLLFEDFMAAFGYEELAAFGGVLDPEAISEVGALVHVAQCQILDRSGNSFPHGLNIWFPPSWLQWDEDDEWSLLFTKEMTYAYSGIGVWLGEDVLMPAEYYCIDCPEMYQDIGLDFTEDTSWMEFFGVYYDSRWLIYGGDTGSRTDYKP